MENRDRNMNYLTRPYCSAVVFKHNPTVLRGVFREPWEPPGVRAAPAWPWAGYRGDTADPSAGARSRTAEPSTADPRHVAGAQERPWRTPGPVTERCCKSATPSGPGPRTAPWCSSFSGEARFWVEREALEKPARQSQGKAGRDFEGTPQCRGAQAVTLHASAVSAPPMHGREAAERLREAGPGLGAHMAEGMNRGPFR